MVSTIQTYFLVSSLNKVSALCRQHQAVRLELVQHFPLTHLWCVTWCCQGCRTSWSGPHDVTFSPSFTLYRLSNLPSTAVSFPRSSLHLLPAMVQTRVLCHSKFSAPSSSPLLRHPFPRAPVPNPLLVCCCKVMPWNHQSLRWLCRIQGVVHFSWSDIWSKASPGHLWIGYVQI